MGDVDTYPTLPIGLRVTTNGELLILGAGGFGVETIEVVNAINASGGGIKLLGMADDRSELRGSNRLGVPILGAIEEVVTAHPRAEVVTTMGNPSSYGARRTVADRLGLPPERYATLVHPTATVPDSAVIGNGSVVHAGVVMTAAVAVGRHVAIMPNAVLTHGDQIGDYATIASGVMVSGDVSIGEGAYLGAGSSIRERLAIGARSLIGIGSTVLRDVPADEVWVGSPARAINSLKHVRS